MENRETKNYGFMSIDTLETMVKKTLDYAEVSCGFAYQGGEPTLVGVDFYRQLLILQKKYNNKGISITNSIQTNGYQIDEECESCEYYHVCRGGCRRHREVDDNGTLGINYFCPSYKRFFAHVLLLMKQIAMELSRI